MIFSVFFYLILNYLLALCYRLDQNFLNIKMILRHCQRVFQEKKEIQLCRINLM